MDQKINLIDGWEGIKPGLMAGNNFIKSQQFPEQFISFQAKLKVSKHCDKDSIIL